MNITVDPKQPILWVRATGLSEWRGVTLFEIRPGTIADPTPTLFKLISLHQDKDATIVPFPLQRDPTGAHLLAAGIQVTSIFDPGGDVSPITVELFIPKVGIHPPAAAVTLQFPFDATLFASQDVDVVEGP